MFFTQICLGILSKWEGEPSSSISRLNTEAKNLLANCELELEARDAMLFYITWGNFVIVDLTAGGGASARRWSGCC